MRNIEKRLNNNSSATFYSYVNMNMKLMTRQLSKRLYMFFTLLIMLPLLNACGGGDSGGSNTNPPSDTNINYQVDVDSTIPTDPYAGTGSFGIEKTDAAINFASGLTRGVGVEPVSYYLVYNYLIITRQLLKLPLVLNAKWTEPDNGSISGWTISSVVTSLSASVSAGGSVYDNCAKITTTISGNGILSGTPATDVESEFIRGTRDVWYAPGVGVVMMQYHHENGYTTTAELQSYSLAKPSTDYFPLDVGDKWTYQWINEYRTEYVTDEYAVVRSCVGPCELPPP